MRGKKYNPDMLIWFESSADFYRLNELLRPIVQKHENAITQPDIKAPQKKGHYFPAYDTAYAELYKKYPQDVLLGMIGEKWKNFFALRGQTPVILALPMYIVTPQQEAWLRELVKDQPFVRIFDGISDLDTEKGLYPDAHPNAVGHTLIARDLYAYLTRDTVIPCQK